MNIDKAKLEKLQGLCPCSSVLTFTPSIYDEFKNDPDMVDVIPVFTCSALTEGQAEKIKHHGANRVKYVKKAESFPNKKSEMISIIGENITGWSNMINVTTGEEVKYSPDIVEMLPENTIESIMMELSRYAGILPRGL